MSKLDYIKECISISAEEMDPPLIMTPEQIAWMADGIDGAMENYGTYSGEEHIPNPLEAEMDRRQRSHAEEVRRIEQREDAKDKVIENLRREVSRLEWRLEERR